MKFLICIFILLLTVPAIAFDDGTLKDTTISPFEIPESNHTTLQVFDLSDRLVQTLIDGELQEEHHTEVFKVESYRHVSICIVCKLTLLFVRGGA